MHYCLYRWFWKNKQPFLKVLRLTQRGSHKTICISLENAAHCPMDRPLYRHWKTTLKIFQKINQKETTSKYKCRNDDEKKPSMLTLSGRINFPNTHINVRICRVPFLCPFEIEIFSTFRFLHFFPCSPKTTRTQWRAARYFFLLFMTVLNWTRNKARCPT